MLRRAVGLRLSVRQLDEYCVLPDFYDVFYGNKQLLFGKSEPLTARNGYAGKAVFGKRDGDIAYSAQIFSVGQTSFCLSWEKVNSIRKTPEICFYYVIIYAAGNNLLPAAPFTVLNLFDPERQNSVRQG